MIQSFLIKNYRLFKELEIKSLKRVNLIVGGNNTGKSALLEALLIYYSKGDTRTLNALLHQRGEWIEYDHKISNQKLEYGLENYRNFFPERKITFESDQAEIYLSENEQKFLRLKLQINDSAGYLIRQPELFYTGKYCYFVRNQPNQEKSVEVSSQENILQENQEGYFTAEMLPSSDNVDSPFAHQLIHSYKSPEHNHLLWDEIQLTPQEDFIIEALRIIEPRIDRLAFDSVTKKAKVRLQSESKPLTLSSMGDGINRILSIALAMVRCEGSIFLIDEFENGLHWSVQENLWKIIFKLAQELDIQVFATTHSTDTLATFQKVTYGEAYTEDAKVIKLKYSKTKQQIKAIELEMETIKISVEGNLEIR